MPLGFLNQACCRVSLRAELIYLIVKMERNDKSSRIWMEPSPDQRLGHAAYRTLSCLFSGKTTRSGCSLARRNEARSGGRTCRLWVTRCDCDYSLPFCISAAKWNVIVLFLSSLLDTLLVVSTSTRQCCSIANMKGVKGWR